MILLESLPAEARLFVDSNVSPGHTYSYYLRLRSVDGDVTWSSESRITASPAAWLAMRQFPNPFNPMTTIEFDLSARNHVELSVYDITGRLVRMLVSDVRSAGNHRVAWSGTDTEGHPASSGVYFYRLVAGAETLNGRMTLLR